jgi:hypothetical protein
MYFVFHGRENSVPSMSEKRIFEFNYLIVIESLTDEDQRTGKMLYNDLIRYASYKINYLKTEFRPINSRNQLFEELQSIKNLVSTSDILPFIHIEMHGSQEGLVANSGEIIFWQSFTEKMREINIITRNNIFISFATCFSAYIAGNILPSQPSPFFGFIGSWDEIPQGDILANFQIFFEFIFSSKDLGAIDFDEAVKRLNASRPGQPLFHFLNSENIFNKVLYDYEKSLEKPGIFNKRIDENVHMAFQDPNIRKKWTPEQLRQETIKIFKKRQPEIKKEMKRTFLMLD